MVPLFCHPCGNINKRCTQGTHTQALLAAAGNLKSRKFSWVVIHFHWIWLGSIINSKPNIINSHCDHLVM